MEKAKQNRIVVFGKGGVGKSTFSANLSAYYAKRGLKVLHIGCDPKGDSTLFLLENMDDLRTVMSWISTEDNDRTPARVFNRGRLGIKCIEAGGPEAGIGCGGRGIARVLEYLEKWDVFNQYDFDVVVFDVLGDVVCGGFAAPLRKGFGNKVVIVVAEDEMSYYAANNIAGAVDRYKSNGVGLAGLVVNRRGSGDPRMKAETFSRLINSAILGTLPPSDVISKARHEGLTAVEYDPDSPFSAEVASVAEKLLLIDAASMPAPTPIDRNVFMKFSIDPDSFSPETLAAKPVVKTLPRVPGKTDGPAIRNEPGDRPRVSRALEELSLISGFMGKNPPLGTMRLAGAEFSDDGSVTLSVQSPSFGSARVSLMKDVSGEADVSTPNFGVFLVEGKLVKPTVKLLRTLAHRLGNFSLEKIREIYTNAEEEQRAHDGGGFSMPGGGDEGDAPKWAAFFAHRQFARNSGQMISYDIPFAQVMHRDVECAYATPPIKSDEFNYYNYPWLPPSMAQWDPGHSSGSATYETCLDESDIILGAKEKLERIVALAIDEIGDKKVFLFNNTCVPVVAGEDVSSIVAETKCMCSVPVMYEGPENSINIDPYLAFFIQLKKEHGFAGLEPASGTINLIGYPDNTGKRELVEILREMNVELNLSFLPKIDVSLFDNYKRASLSVFYPVESYRKIYEEVFDGVDVKKITPDAPFGIKKTQDWIRAVGEGLGLDKEAERVSDGVLEMVREEWDRAVREARNYSLGFVVDGASMKKLADPPRNNGLHIPEILNEMGFGLEFFIYVKEGGSGSVASTSFSEPGRETVFSSREELAGLLSKSGCGSVYSDFYFDERLAAAGKTQFSSQVFEPGCHGAVRSVKRILDLCRMPFFSRYGKYM